MDTQQTGQEIVKPAPKMLQKSIDAIRMVNAGIDPAEALKMVNFKSNISHQAVAELKAKVKKHSLTDPSMVKSMSQQVKRILKSRAREEAHTKVTKDGDVIEYTDNVYPTDTNILAACAMVADRIEPIVHQVASLNLNVDLAPVDLSNLINHHVIEQPSFTLNSKAIDMTNDVDKGI